LAKDIEPEKAVDDKNKEVALPGYRDYKVVCVNINIRACIYFER
jgi:hypothetical protein